MGAYLSESTLDDCVVGVLFFNNVGYLNGCVHGTIGLAVTCPSRRIGPGVHKVEAPTGVLSIGHWSWRGHGSKCP